MKTDFQKIKSDVEEIQKMQAEALNTVQTELRAMLSSLQALEVKALSDEVSGFCFK